MSSQHRRHHIVTARELARDLRDAAARFDDVVLRDLDPAALWTSMQLDAALVARFSRFLELLWLDGIRSQFFAEFEASKLILPTAPDIADRLEKLVDDLERQFAACEKATARPVASELRIEN